MSAKLISLERDTFRSIPETLRRIADDLEKEGCSGAEACLVVGSTDSEEMRVFGMGYADAGTSALLLHAGLLKLVLKVGG